MDAWVASWAAEPQRKVLHDMRRGWIARGQLLHDSTRIARYLASCGAVAGDRILCAAKTSYDLVVFHVAALRMGLVVVPANTAYQEREVRHLVRDAGVKLAVVDDAGRADWIRAAAPDTVVIALGPDGSGRLICDAPDSPLGSDELPLDVAAADDPAVICYTSGTTGVPKGAVLSHRNLITTATALRTAWRWTEADRLLLCLPLFHAHGLLVGLHGSLYAGASAVLLDGFDIDGVLDAAHEHQASMFFGVPTMYERIAASKRLRELARLRLCVSGSAPLSAQTWRVVAAASGQRILERYGLTETLLLASNPVDGERRPGSVGLPLPWVDIRLGSIDHSGVGEIETRGPNVFIGYWQQPQATTESFTSDGWFKTGDLGTLDPDGYLTIVGRKKELIISGGYNVYPQEVESVLRTLPDLDDIAIVGTPSPEWGEVVTAFVVAPSWGEAERARLDDLARRELAPYKRPRLVHVVSAIPRNALGKVLRAELVRATPSPQPTEAHDNTQ